jgi:(p)ppGpp synthase/HD superfamily hydrolase
VLTKRFEDALVYACRAHATQRRKASDIPYVAHLLGVSGIVLEYGGSEDEAIAALLHDVVEDQGGQPRLDEIRNEFGDFVGDIVAHCTEPQDLPWKERKLAYIGQMEIAPSSAILVAAADKLHNARSFARDYRIFGEKLWRRFSKQNQLWFFREVLRVFESRGEHSALVAELRDAIRALDKL